MYVPLSKWLKSELGCRLVRLENDPAGDPPIIFEHIKNWRVDVAGKNQFETYAIEAKHSTDYDSLIKALSQASVYQKAFNFVYICLPQSPHFATGGRNYQNTKEKELVEMLDSECKKKNIGLLMLDDNGEVTYAEDGDAADMVVDKAIPNNDLKSKIYVKVLNQFLLRKQYSVLNSRALMVRDLVYLLSNLNSSVNAAQLGNAFETQANYASTNALDGQNLATVNVNGKGPDIVKSALELELISEDSKSGSIELNALGNSLVEVTNPTEHWDNLSSETKTFFYSILLQFDEIRLADKLIEAGSGLSTGLDDNILKILLDDFLIGEWETAIMHFATNSKTVPFEWNKKKKEWLYNKNFPN